MNRPDVGMSTPKADSPLQQAIERLSDAQFDLDNMLNSLPAILAPVLRAGATGGGSTNDLSSNVKPITSPVVDQINRLTERVKTQIKQVEQLITRLDV